ncbi:NUDIX domain-containing protein [Pseudonocardia sp. GCM10023141]|uniref:NUDIX domain-containing protein n=1 Tax=Pseudonocardia sp. GCM10023141 TaxID=3252653 RepID=UPI0036205F1D
MEEPTTPAATGTPRRHTMPRRAMQPGTHDDPSSQVVVVVAVITCDLGVLLGRRRDQHLAWTFPGGKIKPGESPADAVVREVREETGIRVTVHGELGRRVHLSPTREG